MSVFNLRLALLVLATVWFGCYSAEETEAETHPVHAAKDDTELEILKQEYLKLSQALADLQKTAAQMERNQDQLLRYRPTDYPRQLSSRTWNISSTVAFTAHANTTQQLPAGNVILFSDEQFNSGSFDPVISTFECPETGLYQFTANLLFRADTNSGTSNGATIKVDQTVIATMYTAMSANDNRLSFGSANVIAMCTEGQQVYVQTIDTTTIDHIALDETRTSTFTGLLLAI